MLSEVYKKAKKIKRRNNRHLETNKGLNLPSILASTPASHLNDYDKRSTQSVELLTSASRQDLLVEENNSYISYVGRMPHLMVLFPCQHQNLPLN